MSQKSKTKGNGGVIIPEQVKFHYLKSANFRTIHADGAIGNVTPAGYIHMAMYSERPAIPREMVHKIKPDGTLGEIIEEQTVMREGIVREMEVDVLMSVDVAKGIKNWLDEQFEKVEQRNTQLIKTPSDK